MLASRGGQHTASEHVNPIVPEFLAFSEIIELRCQDCFDVLQIRSHDDSLPGHRGLYRVRTRSGPAQSNKRVIPELERLIAGYSTPKVNEKRQAY
jgi:hypothetical protein